MLFKAYSGQIIQEAVGELSTGIIINGGVVNKLNYADDTSFPADCAMKRGRTRINLNFPAT